MNESQADEYISYTCSNKHIHKDDVRVAYWFMADFVDVKASDVHNNKVRAWVTDRVGEVLIGKSAIDLTDDNVTSQHQREAALHAVVAAKRIMTYRASLNSIYPKIYIPY